MCKKIIPFLMIFAILFSCYSPAVYALDDFSDYTPGNYWKMFWDYAVDNIEAVGNTIGSWFTDLISGYSSYDDFISDGHTDQDFEDAYNTHVQNDLPATCVDSEGGLIWQATVDDIDYSQTHYQTVGNSDILSPDRSYPYLRTFSNYSVETQEYSTFYRFHRLDSSGDFKFTPGGSHNLKCTFLCPFPGTYSVLSNSIKFLYSGTSGGYIYSGGVYRKSKTFSGSSSFVFSEPSYSIVGDGSGHYYTDLIIHFYLPVFRIVPSSGLLDVQSDPTYNINTRVGILNGDYGIIGDNGTIVHSERNYVVNEGDKTYYNPVTNQSYDMSTWTYDYTTRTYDFSTQIVNEEGDTVDQSVSITYGDENITIKEGDTTYTVYYIYEKPAAPAHVHDYQVVERVDPSCTLNGYIRYSCSECLDTYTDILFALGHDWEFIETVPASTDEDTGDPIAGYDRYRCRRCGEERTVPIGTELTDDSSQNTGFFAWLQEWLKDFKTWLGDKIDGIGGDTNITIDPEHNDYTDFTFTYVDEEGTTNEITFQNIKGKFEWVKVVIEIGEDFVTEVTNNEAAAHEYSPGSCDPGSSPSTGAPSIPVNLAAANSHYGYVYGGEVEGLDLSWYTPYKSTVDNIVGGFLWLLFLWGLFKATPNILSGLGISSNKAEDVDRGFKRRR